MITSTLDYLFTVAFRDGGGVSYERVKSSSELRRNYWQIVKTPTHPDLRIAQTAGYWNFGKAINTSREQEALQCAKARNTAFHPDIHTQILLQRLGEALINGASSVLGPEVQQIVTLWPTLASSEQVTALELVHELFRHCSIGQAIKWPERYVPDWARESLHDDTEGGIRSSKYLPYYFPKASTLGQKPSCLGIAMLLIGFARAVGIPALLATPIKTIGSVRTAHFISGLETLFEHVNNKRLTEDNDRQRHYQLLRHTRLRSVCEPEPFHLAVAMMIHGQWIYVDPYLNRFGVMGEQAHRAARLIEKYAPVLPGLTVIASDNGHMESRLARAAKHSLQAIELSRSMYDTLTERGSTIEQAVAIVTKYKADRFALNAWQPEPAEQQVLQKEGLAARIYLLCRPKGDPSDTLEEIAERYRHDTEYRQTWIKRFCTETAVLGFSAYDAALSKRDRLVDPAIQLSLPELLLGLTVLDSLCYSRGLTLPPSFFLSQCFDQVVWHDAMELSRGTRLGRDDARLLTVAKEAIRQLPHIHPLCKHFLREEVRH